MSAPVAESGHPPIYSRLIHERGDVVAEVRSVAEHLHREVARAMDWSGLRHRAGAPTPRPRM
ncbi:hypothetical protein GQS52_00605 [Streptomyces sp. SCUT-3]|uniref:hypothetical protein n=1 Tax=Streptomyces sp. SCUT-3 TaxID=2684469 RepID=UPI0015F9E160|nr:hypothetical protein [Streptomyces sp. SCUT-3]QMV20554.1 hypothetical protein GQS52_00605 [Streptomyces sp. SCUT-3]